MTGTAGRTRARHRRRTCRRSAPFCARRAAAARCLSASRRGRPRNSRYGRTDRPSRARAHLPAQIRQQQPEPVRPVPALLPLNDGTIVTNKDVMARYPDAAGRAVGNVRPAQARGEIRRTAAEEEKAARKRPEERLQKKGRKRSSRRSDGTDAAAVSAQFRGASGDARPGILRQYNGLHDQRQPAAYRTSSARPQQSADAGGPQPGRFRRQAARLKTGRLGIAGLHQCIGRRRHQHQLQGWDDRPDRRAGGAGHGFGLRALGQAQGLQPRRVKWITPNSPSTQVTEYEDKDGSAVGHRRCARSDSPVCAHERRI